MAKETVRRIRLHDRYQTANTITFCKKLKKTIENDYFAYIDITHSADNMDGLKSQNSGQINAPPEHENETATSSYTRDGANSHNASTCHNITEAKTLTSSFKCEDNENAEGNDHALPVTPAIIGLGTESTQAEERGAASTSNASGCDANSKTALPAQDKTKDTTHTSASGCENNNYLLPDQITTSEIPHKETEFKVLDSKQAEGSKEAVSTNKVSGVDTNSINALSDHDKANTQTDTDPSEYEGNDNSGVIVSVLTDQHRTTDTEPAENSMSVLDSNDLSSGDKTECNQASTCNDSGRDANSNDASSSPCVTKAETRTNEKAAIHTSTGKLQTAETPMIVLCLNFSRIGTDIEHALSGIGGCRPSNIAILVLHIIEPHTLPITMPVDNLVGEEYVKYGALVDFAFTSELGIYKCEMKNIAMRKIGEFFKKTEVTKRPAHMTEVTKTPGGKSASNWKWPWSKSEKAETTVQQQNGTEQTTNARDTDDAVIQQWVIKYIKTAKDEIKTEYRAIVDPLIEQFATANREVKELKQILTVQMEEIQSLRESNSNLKGELERQTKDIEKLKKYTNTTMEMSLKK